MGSKSNASGEKKTEVKKFERPASSPLEKKTEVKKFERPPASSPLEKKTEVKKFERPSASSPSKKKEKKPEVKKFERPSASSPFEKETEVKKFERPSASSPSEKKTELKKLERPSSASSLSEKKDAADTQQIEKKLLQLMEDFETGKLKAFGKDSRLRQMEEIREQQEKLAKLHFDVGAEQDLYPPLSEDGLRISEENMTTLMKKLAQLSESIENLHSNTYVDRKTGILDAKVSNASTHPTSAEGEVFGNNRSSTPNLQHAKTYSANGHVTLHHLPKFSATVHAPKDHKEQPQVHTASHDASPSFVHMANSHKIISPLNINAFNKHENASVGIQMKSMNNAHQEFSSNIKVKHHN